VDLSFNEQKKKDLKQKHNRRKKKFEQNLNKNVKNHDILALEL